MNASRLRGGGVSEMHGVHSQQVSSSETVLIKDVSVDVDETCKTKPATAMLTHEPDVWVLGAIASHLAIWQGETFDLLHNSESSKMQAHVICMNDVSVVVGDHKGERLARELRDGPVKKEILGQSFIGSNK